MTHTWLTILHQAELDATNAKVEELFTNLEAAQAQLLRAQMTALVACQVLQYVSCVHKRA